MTPGSWVRDLDSFVRGQRRRFEEELEALVEVPTVSMDPSHRGDVDRGADLARALLVASGARARKVKTKGSPVVVGELPGDRRWPIVTIYNHLDVQPADPAEWRYPPFEFRRDGDDYLGRGTTDDKGPALTALMAARFVVAKGIPIRVRFVWELEEEVGSPSFDGFLVEQGERLRTDSVLVSDTIWIARDRPAVPYGLRGLQALRLVLETGAKDVHSGLTGGLARNPIGELCDVIARCYDARTGKVKIPGFYDRVRQPSRREVDSFIRSGFRLQSFRAAHELKSLRRVHAQEAVRRIWSMPTFEVHGIGGGYQGPGVKTIVPARAEAKLSMRLVPDMRPAESFRLVKAFVKEVNPDVQVIRGHALEPYLGEFSGRHASAASDALRFGFGREPAFVREGGSIGAVVSMKKRWGCPIVFIGLSLPEHGYHCPDERFDWGQATGGARAFVKYLDSLARLHGE